MPPGGTNPAYHIRKQAVATVTAVREGCSRRELAPAAAGRTMVIDHRLPPMAMPPEAAPFSVFEIQQLGQFIARLNRRGDEVSAFLWQKLSIPDQAILSNYHPSATISKESADVIQALNKFIEGPCIYDKARFQGISLRPETTDLLKERPKGAKLAQLNRLLLEDAFPEMRRPAPLSTYVVQNGVQWVAVEKAQQMYVKPRGPPQMRASKVTGVFDRASVRMLR